MEPFVLLELATDIICHFTTRGPVYAQKVGHRIDRSVRRLGFRCSPQKHVTGVVDESALGLIFFVTNSFGHLHTLARPLQAFVLSCRLESAPVNLAAVLSVCQCFDLLVRPLLSVFFSSYEFAKRTLQKTHQVILQASARRQHTASGN